MEPKKTHREVKNPQISARYLADYMAASERAKRSIVRNCKYQAIARVVQHDEAKAAVSRFIRDGEDDVAALVGTAQDIRDRLADSDFERDLLDHNADYIDRFAKISSQIVLPKAEILKPGQAAPLKLKGVNITTEIHFRLRRKTKTNQVRIGAAALRYAKGKALAVANAQWHSAFLYGYLNKVGVEEGAQPEQKLCLIVDAYAGVCYPAPTDSTKRFHNMTAACATIAEWWPQVDPPPNAVL